MLENLHWLGHASFLYEGRKRIYFDPWQLKAGAKPADLILISHEHYDHLSPEDVAKVQTPNTVIVTAVDCAAKLTGNVITLKPGETTEVAGIRIEAVRAYNRNKPFHPMPKGWLGLVADIDGFVIYHAGDTDHIPEMKGVKADVALLPVGGTYTMTADEAARATLDITHKIAIPMHYGSIVGSEKDARRFASLVKRVEVRIMEAGK